MTYNSRPRQVLQIPLDKLLFFIASLYFGLTVTWIFTHQKPKQVNVASANPKSPSNKEFIAHLEKSLEIEQKTVTAKIAKPSPQTTSVPPPVVRIAPPPPPPVMSPPTTPVERIYIPVYPQNPSFAPAKPKKITASSIPLPPPPPPSPVVTVAPSAIPLPPIQYNSTGSKLVGVLESGERSSALFDVNGLTKRVAIGENVNGWVIVRIQNEQVFLNRGSTTKVIDVGQSL